MPVYFRQTVLPQRTVLFLGYSLEDWNFRVIWEGVLSDYGNKTDSYALVKSSSEFQKYFWAKRNIKIIDLDLTDFAIKLAGHFDLEIPQLGIKKGQIPTPTPLQGGERPEAGRV